MNNEEMYKFTCDCWCNFKTNQYDLTIELDFTESEYREDIDMLYAEYSDSETLEDLISNEHLNFIFSYDYEVGSRLIIGDYIKSVKYKGKELPRSVWHEYL